MSTEKRLYERSVAAAQRYMIAPPKKYNEVAHAIWTAQFEMYRAGWMIGFRAGARRSKRR